MYCNTYTGEGVVCKEGRLSSPLQKLDLAIQTGQGPNLLVTSISLEAEFE